MTDKVVKDVAYYLSLPYVMEFIPDEDGGFAVRIPLLKGCISQGETIEDAYAMIRDAMEGWLAVMIENGWPIPEPEREHA